MRTTPAAERAILSYYDEHEAVLRRFTEKAKSLLIDLLDAEGIRVHSISARTKNRDSLAKKLRRAEKGYSQPAELTDLCGIRIITYFDDETSAVADVISNAFEIDSKNSVNKLDTLDPDQFGYLSSHYVGRLSSARLRLPEYAAFQSLTVEVQVRSILQHAWAEIEHDIGYKTELAVPKRLRRQFSRLAGLLELADEEFRAIRDGIQTYKDDVNRQLEAGDNDIAIDATSLSQFIMNDDLVAQLDHDIAAIGQGNLEDAMFYQDDAFSSQSHLDQIRWLKVRTLHELHGLLHANADAVRRTAEAILADDPFDGDGEVPLGICLDFLGYELLRQQQPDLAMIADYLSAAQIGDTEDSFEGQSRNEIAAEPLAIFAKMEG